MAVILISKKVSTLGERKVRRDGRGESDRDVPHPCRESDQTRHQDAPAQAFPPGPLSGGKGTIELREEDETEVVEGGGDGRRGMEVEVEEVERKEREKEGVG